MGLYYKKTTNQIIVFGQTFLFKDALKRLGGTFDYVSKTWQLPLSEENIFRISHLCDSEKNTASAEKSLRLHVKEEDGLTIRSLLHQVSAAIQRSFPNTVWVVGELENVTKKNGHIYCQLSEPKDNEEIATLSVRAVAWSQTLDYLIAKHPADKVKDIFQEGIKVRVLCRIEFYKDRANISLVIEDIDLEYTQGALARARERVLKKLRAQGLDQKNKQLDVSDFPFRVALITAEDSRAFSDFVDQLHSGGFPGEILFSPTAMQGDSVKNCVLASFDILESMNPDLIVITRGGGSAADLRWFDDEDIAIRVANSSVPVIAAIGHHDDVCILEEIAHTRQKTPTAAAEWILGKFRDSRNRINDLHFHLQETIRDVCDALLNVNTTLISRIASASTRGAATLAESVWRLLSNLDKGTDQKMNTAERRALEFKQAFLSRDPRPWIAQGWTQLICDGRKITSTSEVSIQSQIGARLLDGRIIMEVKEITPLKESRV